MSGNKWVAARAERRGPQRARLRAGVPVARVPRRNGAAFLIAAFGVAFLLLARPADAHAVGISRGDYALHGNTVTASLVFARPEIATTVPALDIDHDGTISEDELQNAKHELGAAIIDRIRVDNGAATCSGRLEAANLAEEDGLSIHAVFDCATSPSGATATLGFLDAMSHGHRHLASLASAQSRAVLYAGHERFDVSPSVRSEQNLAGEVWSLFALGIEHILTGYDHLVFLFGLIVVGGRLRSTILALTAFTVAHSITLGLSTLGVWSPGPSLVEPAIALSIAYVGVENWFVESVDRRWALTFAFGLIHGFGFAGALREISLPAGQVPLALAAFNGGVEIGQLLVLVAALPALALLRRHIWFANYGVRFASAVVAVAGAVWFVARIA